MNEQQPTLISILGALAESLSEIQEQLRRIEPPEAERESPDYTAKALAAKMSTTPKEIYEMIQKGEFNFGEDRPYKKGRSLRIPQRVVDRYERENAVEPRLTAADRRAAGTERARYGNKGKGEQYKGEKKWV